MARSKSPDPGHPAKNMSSEEWDDLEHVSYEGKTETISTIRDAGNGETEEDAMDIMEANKNSDARVLVNIHDGESDLMIPMFYSSQSAPDGIPMNVLWEHYQESGFSSVKDFLADYAHGYDVKPENIDGIQFIINHEGEEQSIFSAMGDFIKDFIDDITG